MVIDLLFKILGALGLILITSGVLIRKRNKEDIFYFFGGICLLMYSIYIKDPIFIPLQAIFIASVSFDYIRLKYKKKKPKKR